MVQQLLLAGQLLVVILIYLFVWRLMRAAIRDVRGGGDARAALAPGAIHAQESTIIPAADVARARDAAGLQEARIVVVASDVLRAGVPYTIANGLRIGRASDNDVVLDDAHVSSHHARIVAPHTLVDLDSTNGTFVNGQQVTGRTALRAGQQFSIGTTTFRFEASS